MMRRSQGSACSTAPGATALSLPGGRPKWDPGHSVLDLGCGPGFASLDLAGLVGSGGGVVAIAKSQRFPTTLQRTCRERGVANIATHQADLDADELPEVMVDRV
jgi:precorrin-6B methylase 2